MVGCLLVSIARNQHVSWTARVPSRFLNYSASLLCIMQPWIRAEFQKQSPCQSSFLTLPVMRLRAYTDADWASAPTTNKSTTCYCIFLGSTLILWKSKIQNGVSLSSTGKYRAMSTTTTEIAHLRWILDGFGVHVRHFAATTWMPTNGLQPGLSTKD